jgi:uncharacterized membrane protein SirB2
MLPAPCNRHIDKMPPAPQPTDLSAAMSYLAIKHIHMTCAALSGSFFLLRGIWMLLDSAMLQRRWVKIAPHIIDTVLLASALAMVVWSSQYPFVQSWLTAKVFALIAYILLGTVALKRGKTKGVRTTAFIAALLVFSYIVKVALTRQVL